MKYMNTHTRHPSICRRLARLAYGIAPWRRLRRIVKPTSRLLGMEPMNLEGTNQGGGFRNQIQPERSGSADSQ
jgi:hypothetical protein